MRVEPNMLLRGSVWSFRMAVPKALRELREKAGLPAGSREIWRSLGTGDKNAARLRLAEAKAALLHEFEAEMSRLAGRARVVPTDAQLERAVFAFKVEERAALQQERLHYVPTGRQVRTAQEQLFLIDQSRAQGSLSTLEAVLEGLDANALIGRSESLARRRTALRTELVDHLANNEFALIDWAIEAIAERHGYLIEPDGRSYRLLGSLLIRAWIQELDAADAVAMDLDIPSTTANLFSQGHLGQQVSANDAPPVPPSDSPAAPVERNILTLFDTYWAEQKSKVSASGEAEARRTIQQFVEVSGITDVTLFRKAHLAAYKQQLQKLPPNAARDYPGMTVAQIIASVPAGSARLKPKTINSRLSLLAVFGKWLANTTDDVNASVFSTAALPVGGSSDKMEEFTDAEVCAIFLQPTFTGCESERNQKAPGTYRVRDYRFWLPLMAAYTGCRLNELTQLRLEDILDLQGTLCLLITDEGEGQSLKNQQSKRRVPVHSALLKVGFLERVSAARQAGWKNFFEDIPVDRHGRRSETAGKRFRKYIQRIGVKGAGDRGGMHRFRHTVVEKLRTSGLFDHQIAPLVGHGTGIALMTADYGSSQQMTVEQRKEAIERLTYEGLDLDRLT